MERLPPKLAIAVAAIAALGIGGQPNLIQLGGRSRYYANRKPLKLCRAQGCGRIHDTGKPCCSAECHRAWKAGEAVNAPLVQPQIITTDITHEERDSRPPPELP